MNGSSLVKSDSNGGATLLEDGAAGGAGALVAEGGHDAVRCAVIPEAVRDLNREGVDRHAVDKRVTAQECIRLEATVFRGRNNDGVVNEVGRVAELDGTGVVCLNRHGIASLDRGWLDRENTEASSFGALGDDGSSGGENSGEFEERGHH